MRRLTALVICSLFLAGCISHRSQPQQHPSAGNASEKTGGRPNATVASPVQVVGRIIAVDMPTLAVIIELGPYATLPNAINGSILIAREDDLRPTARLQASPYLFGRTLGARLIAGQPRVGDEVVIPPAQL
jgi:hypothetical protein